MKKNGNMRLHDCLLHTVRTDKRILIKMHKIIQNSGDNDSRTLQKLMCF